MKLKYNSLFFDMYIWELTNINYEWHGHKVITVTKNQVVYAVRVDVYKQIISSICPHAILTKKDFVFDAALSVRFEVNADIIIRVEEIKAGMILGQKKKSIINTMHMFPTTEHNKYYLIGKS